MANGYMGKILEVDLGTGKFDEFDTTEDARRKFLGGSGMASWLLLDRYDPLVSPDSPENPLFIMTGPLTGSHFPGCGRFTASAISPLTGIWGEGNCGGNFGPEMKFAGFDGIVLTGKAEKPVYLALEEGKAELRDARELWGKDTYETIDILKEQHTNGRKVKVLTIGPAGENGVKFACIINDKGDAVGRCGLGTVMGSKNLKAIIARGSAKVELALPEEAKSLRTEVMEAVKAGTQGLKRFGTNAVMLFGFNVGDIPIHNWAKGEDGEATDTIGPVPYSKDYLVKGGACYGCPVACKRVVKVKEGPYAVEEGPGPEYETCASFGTLLDNHNLEAIIKINEICNRIGIDTISGGSTIAMATELFDKGILTTGDTDGLELKWGDPDVVIKLLEKISKKEGIGELLSLGSRELARKVGKGAEDYAMEVKGLELPMHDPRGFHGMGLNYAVSTRGACHLQHINGWIEPGFYSASAELGIPTGLQGRQSDGKSKASLIAENFGIPAGSAVVCLFILTNIPPKLIPEMLRTTTGFDFDIEGFLKMGERLWYLKRGITNLQGITRADDRLPKRILTAVEEGPHKGSTPDIKLLLKEYYELRGIDEKGKPTRERLEEAGLKELADRLHPAA